MQDITGQRFGRLVVESFSHKDGHGAHHWKVVCDCGTRKTASKTNLFGKTKSCGCLKRETNGSNLRTHGESGTRTHRIWKGMISRCYTPSASGFSNYGGRGIIVFQAWRDSYAAFLSDMGECPDGYSIERIDTNGHYVPENCKWIPRPQQARNTRRNRNAVPGDMTPLVVSALGAPVEYNSVRQRLNRGWSATEALSLPRHTKRSARKISANGQKKTIADWAITLGMDARSLRGRLESGWTEEDAVLTPRGLPKPFHEASSESSPEET